VSVAIRHARAAEAEAILRFWAASDAVPSLTDDVAGVEALLARDPRALLVADVDGRIAGTIVVGWDGWRACLYRLAVLPELRRHGIATALVAAAETQLQELGARRLHLIVVADEEAAAGFWESAGYQQQAGRLRFVKNV